MQSDQSSEVAVQTLIFTFLNEDIDLTQVLHAIESPHGLQNIPSWLQVYWDNTTTLKTVVKEHRNVLMNTLLDIIRVAQDKIDFIFAHDHLRYFLFHKCKQDNVARLQNLENDIKTVSHYYSGLS